MVVLTGTGVYLTWIRLDRWDQFFSNTFGLMLFTKIVLFLIMVCIGITAITIVHRGMKKEVKGGGAPGKGDEITHADLGRFDGTGGEAAYILYKDAVYDVTDSPKWKEGRHFGKHAAGDDLTKAMEGAPHGPEVLEKVKRAGTVAGSGGKRVPTGPAHRVFVVMVYANLVIIFLILACISVWRWDFPLRLLPETRAEVIAGKGCLACHGTENPGLVADWKSSVHASVGVDCYICHRAEEAIGLASKNHLDYDSNPVAVVVSPRTCAGCHPEEATQYAASKHANTLEIIWKVDHWLRDGMNSTVERTTGCYACHGTVVEIAEGRPKPGTWPNVGVGRKNPDGSLGSCSSCHTRHKFSVVEARKPEACDQCHLGPDHPQIEIYNESKHGTIYHAEGDRWQWSPDDRQWKAGRDFRAPTCAACHMSGTGDLERSHDVTERLSWETQAALTVRPADFKPFPAESDWKTERNKMKSVCLQCHSPVWADDHFSNFDRVIEHYNEDYYTPAKDRVESLYEAGLLSRETYFDEPLEWEFYELWHHEGRRARMGTAMMAPDYAWWHGFYELKHRFATLFAEADRLEKTGEAETYADFPGKHREGP
jgi:predicted heme/steroid binding protein